MNKFQRLMSRMRAKGVDHFTLQVTANAHKFDPNKHINGPTKPKVE